MEVNMEVQTSRYISHHFTNGFMASLG
jgi:hypothetical protein